VDLDLALVSAVIAEGPDALRNVQELGVQHDSLEGEGKKLFGFVVEFVAQHGKVPSTELIQAKFGVPLEPVKEPATFFGTEVLNRALHLDLKKGADGIIAKLGEAQPREALDLVEKLLQDVRKDHTLGSSRIDSIPRLFGDVLSYYDRVKSGEKGVLTPWPTVNEETLGFWPEDLALFVARVGIGKTWTASLLGHFAWKSGHRVLFGTTEMSKMRIAMRFAALHFKLPYRDIRLGRLDAFEEIKFRKGIKEIMDSEGLYVIGGDFDFRVESYEAAIKEANPALSILDGAYLLKTQGANRIERAAEAFNELKRVCKRSECPNVVTMQFNREVKANSASTVQVEKIALTDVASWNADLIYGLIQTEDMKRDRRMILKPLKVREGEGEEFEINWDIDHSDFTELPKAGPQSGSDADDDFGTGIDSNKSAEVPF